MKTKKPIRWTEKQRLSVISEIIKTDKTVLNTERMAVMVYLVFVITDLPKWNCDRIWEDIVRYIDNPDSGCSFIVESVPHNKPIFTLRMN